MTTTPYAASHVTQDAPGARAVVESALAYLAAGRSTLPVAAGSKVPGYYDPGRNGYGRLSWKKYQSQRIDAGTLEQLFRHGIHGVSIVTGKVSGIEVAGTWYGLEVMDFDDPSVFDEFIEAANFQGLGDLLTWLVRERTPRMGGHLGYLCATVEGNQPLARRPPEDGEDGPVVVIETRGEGGQCVVAPTPPGVHPDMPARGYELTHGNWEDPPIITNEDRAALFALARSFNRYVEPRNVYKPVGQPRPGTSGARPGDALNASVDQDWWTALLEQHGWKCLGQRREIMDWQRPGKDGPGASATLGACGPYLYVFSSNAAPFEAGRAYAPFSAYCLLEHAGDAKQAARALAQAQRRSGTGTQPKTSAEGDTHTHDGAEIRARFAIDDAGVWYTPPPDVNGDQPPVVWVCNRLDIVAATSDVDNNNHGHLLSFHDRHTYPQQWAMPLELLEERREYRKVLRRLGLIMNGSRDGQSALQLYLDVCHAEDRARCVDRVGWHHRAYVLPDGPIGDTNGEMLVLQTLDKKSEGYRQAGSLEGWQQEIAARCVGNSRLVVSVSTGFAAPLLALLGEESGGLHLRGASSEGKTTAVLVAATVWGEPGRMERWRATANALEGVCLAHNDNLLCLDELKELDPREAGITSYMIANGAGKRRGQPHGGTLPRLTWRLLFLSTGEMTLEQHMTEAGYRIRAGQEVRMVDLPADAGAGYGLFEYLHGAPSAEKFADQLREAVTRNYGHAGRRFVEVVAADIAGCTDQVRALMDGFVADHVPLGATGQVLRVARRFALIGAAGELATDSGITGWPEGEAIQAAARCLKVWLAERGSTGDAEETRALAQVRHFFEAYGRSRFEPWTLGEGKTCQRCTGTGKVDYSYLQGICFDCHGAGVITADHPAMRLIQSRAGWSKATADGRTEFYVLREVFKQDIAKGYDLPWLCGLLVTQTFLLPDGDGKHTRKERLPGKGLDRVYRITADLLGEATPD